ncbi:hypothetical protein MSAN_02448700 [Mycena sanguinolenta]|uniref:Uncharacterized protein n=1 Tax=Mycena sanguinolenta TaxID=230812 RepID=A0A8H6WYB4_9AGAR|nr:hypothetical protein MSAN_02448700 [Mycena sanguinolenta]
MSIPLSFSPPPRRALHMRAASSALCYVRVPLGLLVGHPYSQRCHSRTSPQAPSTPKACISADEQSRPTRRWIHRPSRPGFMHPRDPLKSFLTRPPTATLLAVPAGVCTLDTSRTRLVPDATYPRRRPREGCLRASVQALTSSLTSTSALLNLDLTPFTCRSCPHVPALCARIPRNLRARISLARQCTLLSRVRSLSSRPYPVPAIRATYAYPLSMSRRHERPASHPRLRVLLCLPCSAGGGAGSEMWVHDK